MIIINNVILFTHSQDIDGVNCIILAKYAFKNLTVVPCETFKITEEVTNYYESGNLDKFDLIIITDLCIKEPLLSKINSDKKIRSKIQILDHHKTEIEEDNNKYPFVNITVEKNGKKESGVSLLYEYLIAKRYLHKSNFFDDLVETTRQYDVWDWKKNNNQKSRDLHILFSVLGIEKYLNIIYNLSQESDSLQFDSSSIAIIENYERKIKSEIEAVLQGLIIVDIIIDKDKYLVGFIKCLYSLRNDIPEYIKNQKTLIWI